TTRADRLWLARRVRERLRSQLRLLKYPTVVSCRRALRPAAFFCGSAPLALAGGNRHPIGRCMLCRLRILVSYVLAFTIALFAGWWVAAIDSLFRCEQRPGLFAGTPGMVMLLVAAAAGGFLVAGAVIWVARVVPSASVALIIAVGGIAGAKAS